MSALRPRYDWLTELCGLLPRGMKILLHGADVFTYAWQLIGFEQFCLKSIEEPQLISALMDSLAAAQLNAMKQAINLAGDHVGAVLYSDDIAYTEGLMLSPSFFRGFLFEHIRSFADLGRPVNAPLIYHSDGRLYDVFDDLHAAGVRAVQPLEPKSMDPVEIKRRWPHKFALLGNIDLDLMSRGSLADVEREVRSKIERVAAADPRGGYMPGVSNTVPYYVPFENYCHMLNVIHGLPDGEL